MSTILVDNLTGKTSAGSITVTSEGGAATQSLQQGLAKAWVNFTTITTTSSNDSLNVSGLVDNGTGQTQVSFVNSMSAATYLGVGITNGYNGTGSGFFTSNAQCFILGRTTGLYLHENYTNAYIDGALNDSAIHGDLA